MKILISASMRHYKKLLPVAERLRASGFAVELPDASDGATKTEYIKQHMNKMLESDILIIGNIDGYVGASTFFESGWAYALKKPIFVLEKLDENSIYTEDLRAISVTVLENDFNKLNIASSLTT
jgi:nucleoside 2-deoxyribosyltransferase